MVDQVKHFLTGDAKSKVIRILDKYGQTPVNWNDFRPQLIKALDPAGANWPERIYREMQDF